MKLHDITSTAFKYSYNGLIVKVKIAVFEDDNEVIFSIGLSNPNNEYNYENWFTKYGFIDQNKEVNIGNKFIEHPSYLYYRKWLLKENSLDVFFNEFENQVRNASITDVNLQLKKINSGNSSVRLYPVTFVKLSNGCISNNTIEIIKLRFPPKEAQKTIQHCKRKNLTVKFTDNIENRKKLKLNY